MNRSAGNGIQGNWRRQFDCCMCTNDPIAAWGILHRGLAIIALRCTDAATQTRIDHSLHLMSWSLFLWRSALLNIHVIRTTTYQHTRARRMAAGQASVILQPGQCKHGIKRCRLQPRHLGSPPQAGLAPPVLRRTLLHWCPHPLMLPPLSMDAASGSHAASTQSHVTRGADRCSTAHCQLLRSRARADSCVSAAGALLGVTPCAEHSTQAWYPCQRTPQGHGAVQTVCLPPCLPAAAVAVDWAGNGALQMQPPGGLQPMPHGVHGSARPFHHCHVRCRMSFGR